MNFLKMPSWTLSPGPATASGGNRRGGFKPKFASLKFPLLLLAASSLLLLSLDQIQAQGDDTAPNVYDNCVPQNFSQRCLNNPLMNLPAQTSYPATFFEQLAAQASGTAAPPASSGGWRRLLSVQDEYDTPPFDRIHPQSEFSKLIESIHEPYIQMGRRRELTEEEKEKLLLRYSPHHRHMRQKNRRLQTTSSNGTVTSPTAISLQAPPLNSAPTEGFLSLSSPRYASIYQIPVADWRLPGFDTGIQNQGLCDSCWVVPTVDLISITYAATSKAALVKLSPQHVCDCGTGTCCHGGWPENAFMFGKANGGFASLAAYPYQASDGICKSVSASSLIAPVKTWEMVPAGSTFALLQAVANHPVLVLVDFSSPSAIFYGGGIFTGPCTTTNIDHAVLVMGYNLNSAVPYILLKNSWGSSWGEGGYMRIAIVDDGVGTCGMLSEPAMYPVFYENKTAAQICAGRPNPCGSGSCYVDSTGAARCSCKPGFVEFRTTFTPKCITSTPCSKNPSPCGVGKCTNQFDGQYTCSCPSGTVVGSKADGTLTCVLATYQSGLPTHSILAFDTCESIVSTFNITLTLFQFLNPFIDCTLPLPLGVSVLVANVSGGLSVQCQAMDQVRPNDSCADITARNAISLAQLQGLNTNINCSALTPGRQVCVLPGMLAPTQGSLTSCGSIYTTTTGQRCSDVAAAVNLTLTPFTAINPQLRCGSKILVTATQVCASLLTTNLLSVTCTAWYTVTAGDTCFKIYNAMRLSAVQFMNLNPGLRCTEPFFQVGAQVCVNGTFTPSSAVVVPPNYLTYIVRQNDTLQSIAAAYAATCSSSNLLLDICNANTLPNCGLFAVTPGQVLLVPCSKGVGGNSICPRSLPICGATGLSYNSYCDALLDFGLPGTAVTTGCSSAVTICASHALQWYPKPNQCPFGPFDLNWSSNPNNATTLACTGSLSKSVSDCINHQCCVQCTASTRNFDINRVPTWLSSANTASRWYETCMYNCVDVRTYSRFTWGGKCISGAAWGYRTPNYAYGYGPA